MGINFGKIAQGVATGYLGAAIKDKESKDNARLEVVKAAGMDYYTNQFLQLSTQKYCNSLLWIV